MWNPFKGLTRRPVRRRPLCRERLSLLELESRLVPANVLTYHNDVASTGVNSAETQLTRANVNSTTFGKLFQVQVQGQVYAQPLVMQNVNVTTGPNAGVHDVVFVVTEHDQLYAFDAAAPTGVLLWQRDFLDITNANNHLPNATALTTVPQADVNTSDITNEIGITGTPVIDLAANTLYVIVKTKETVGGTGHWVQRLHAVNIQNGADRAVSLIGDTTGTNANNTPIYVYGTGNGAVTDPYNGTGRQVVQFNALREHQRPALTLVNGVVYAGWASHGDNGPYHGWMVGWDAATLALKGVLNTTPNGGLGGIWMAGGALSFDGTYFYFETGNGTFDGNNGSITTSNPTAPAPGPVTGLDAQGFPVNGDYGDSFCKAALDPTTTPQNQNVNGWGLKIVDYFTPFNQAYLNSRDLDVGSSACVVVPDTYGSAAHPRLLIGSGKEGVIYLIDRDNMGKYGLSNNIVQNTANQLSGSLDTAAIYNGRIYYVEGYGGTAKTFTLANGVLSTMPETRSTDSFAFAGSTPSVSSNGLTDGIVWDIDRGTNQLRAYSTDAYATELYTSDQAPNGRDSLGAAVKFQVATVANGRVYVGSGTGDPNDFLVVYGLITPPNAPPAAPSNLAAQPVSSSQINLTWTNNAASPNVADGFYVEQSPNGTSNWTQIATATGTAYSVGGLSPATTYYFRIRAFNAVGTSAYTNPPVAATTSNQGNTINYPANFSTYPNGGALTFNGGAAITSNRLRLTSGANNQARSVFATAQQNINAFTTTFTYTKSGSADGVTFVVHRDPRGLTALGGGGGSLAYGGTGAITPSFVLAINIYNGHPYGTEFLTNGTIDFNYTQTHINTSLNNTPITVTITYYGGRTLTATLTQGSNSETKTFTFATNLATLLGGSTAYVGFTGATGGANSTQDILSWTYAPLTPPDVPTNLQAQVTGYTAGSTQAVPLGAHLTWNAAAGASGYKIERKLTAGGTYQQIGTSNTTNFDDTGLATQATYFYRVRATNQVGDGAYSTEVSITTPALAPTPTDAHTTNVTTTSITFNWTDNANNEDGFQIFRSVNQGTFTLLVSVPANTPPAPSVVSYTDSGLTPGTRYDYHIQAFNLAGYSDFAGVTTATLTLAPTGLSTAARSGQVTLTWSAPNGAVTYNVYRGTTPGGESPTPVATGLTATTYTDTGLVDGTTYYYTVTAVDAGGEGAASNEASATPKAPPRVQSVQIDDGTAQRSRVASLTVAFDSIITFVGDPTAAFRLDGPGGSVIGLSVSAIDNSSGHSVVTLTFTSGTFGGSLTDGRYVLTVLAGHVQDAQGNLSQADSVTNFFRLYGDANGDGRVDNTDFFLFRSTFGLSVGQPGYLSYFDYDGNGIIDNTDFFQFRARFGTILP
jgi:hypothetical protein